LNIISLPADRADATGINSVTGKFRSANTCNIFVPTSPVAPTTATFIFLFFYVIIILIENFKSFVLQRLSKRKKPSILLEGF
jgi:hypothetical protein